MNDAELAVTAYYFLFRKKKKSKNKRFWVHPYIDRRLSKQTFSTFYGELRQHHDKFFNFTRMAVNSFDELLERIRPNIMGQDTRMRFCIAAEEKLLITLR